MDTKAIVKVQALWRGYSTRKQSVVAEPPDIQFGCECGDWMCSSPSQHYSLAEKDRLFVESQLMRFERFFCRRFD